jgi:DNA-binding NtrC family response regulator
METESSVLLIDDPCEWQATIAILRRLCCIVVTASGAKEALKRLRTGRFDLVILELNLPDLNGLCLLSILKRLYPDLSVLVLTWDPSVESMVRALRLKADGYLHKLDDRQQIFICLQEILKQRSGTFPAGLDALPHQGIGYGSSLQKTN